MAKKRGSELVFQDVRARRSRAGLSLLPARHPASSGRCCPQSPWWAPPVAGTGEQLRHAREAQAPGRPQRAHGECGLQARSMRRGGYTQGGAQEHTRQGWATACMLLAGGRSWVQTAAVGPAALSPRPSRMACWGPGAILGMGPEHSGHRLLVQPPLLPLLLLWHYLGLPVS